MSCARQSRPCASSSGGVEPAHELATRPVLEIGGRDDALGLHRVAHLHVAQGDEARVVLVAQRKVQDQVLLARDPELGELFREARAGRCALAGLPGGARGTLRGHGGASVAAEDAAAPRQGCASIVPFTTAIQSMPPVKYVLAALSVLLAGPLAWAQLTQSPAFADESARASMRRFRSASDPAEARRAFEELRSRSTTSPQAALACGLLAGQAGSLVYDRAVAISCLREGARAGSPESRYHLAVMLVKDKGAGRAEREAEAERLLGQAAPSSPESVYLLAKLRAERSPNPAAALRTVVEDAAKAGYAPAQREWAHRLIEGGRHDDAMAWLEKAWSQGDAEAGYDLATLLAARRAGADLPRIVELLDQASQQGSARAGYALGLRYLDALGVKRDTVRAATLFQRAATAGLADGQYAWGHVLADGIGVPANESAALAWFEAAASQGHVEAMYALGNAHANGWGTGKSMDMAYRWYCRAAQNGLERAIKLVRASSLGRDCDLTAPMRSPTLLKGRSPRRDRRDRTCAMDSPGRRWVRSVEGPAHEREKPPSRRG